MSRSRTCRCIWRIVPVLVLSLLAHGDAHATVGRTTAVVPQAQGTPPGQPTRTLQPKLDVFMNERIQTDDGGVTQILFVDGTNLTVGPHSDLIIDRFAYNPETSTGELVGRLTRGVLRFVGGQVSKRGTVELSTPVAVIGVRGGIAVVEHDTTDETSAFFLFGDSATVTGLGPGAQPGETRTITRAGYTTTVSANGLVADAAPIEPAELAAVLRGLEARAGISQVSRAAVEKSASSYTDEDEEQTEAVDLESQPIPGAAEDVVQQADVTLPPPRSPASLWVYDLVHSTATYSTPVPTLEQLHSDPTNQLIMVKPEGETFDDGPYRGLYVASHFAGKGSAQQAAVTVMLPYLWSSDASMENIPVSLNEIGAVRDPSITEDGRPVTYTLRPNRDRSDDPEPDGAPGFTSTTPSDSFRFTSGTSDTAYRGYLQSTKPGDVISAADLVQDFRLNNVVRIRSHNTPHAPQTWHGYATGLFEGRDRYNGTRLDYTMGTSGNSPTSVTFVHGNATDQFGGQFLLEYGEGNPGGTQSMEINFGRRPGQQEETQQRHPEFNSVSITRGTYLNDDIFAAHSSLAYNAENPSQTQRLMLVDDKLVYSSGSDVLDHRGNHPGVNRAWLFSNAAAPATGLLPAGVEFCNCPRCAFRMVGRTARLS